LGGKAADKAANKCRLHLLILNPEEGLDLLISCSTRNIVLN
jgi:hypothetical protein